MKKRKILINPKTLSGISASLISIIIGLILGLILLFVFDSSRALVGFGALIGTGISTAEKFAKVLYQAAPLLLTGLSVAFAFKTGLFNIGAPGQYTVGMFCALFSAIILGLPWYISLILAFIGGALWGLLPGLLKAQFNVNEVITSIMLNWTGLFLVNLLIKNIPQMIQSFWAGSVSNRTANLALVESHFGTQTTIPKAGLDALLGGSSYMNISIFIAIIIAIIVHVILNKTTFGYELKACGLNKNASTYAGINAKRNIIFSMIIAGGIAGIAGGIYYLSGTAEYVIEKNLLAMGFNGIPVALLASSNPIGVIFSSLFISYIQVGGEALQRYQYSAEIINIIISAIIYLSAFAFLFRLYIEKILTKKEKKNQTIIGENKEVQSK